MPRKRRKNKDRTEYITEIVGLSHDGRGIARIDGKTVFINGALPNETVKFYYTKRNSRYDEAQVTEVLKPANERVLPKCPHYGVCGGCSLQHMQHEIQLTTKTDTFLELFTHQADIQITNLLPPLTADPWGYRRKARLSVKYVPGKNKVLVGFREKNSHFVANNESCVVLDSRVGNHINALSEMLMQLSIRDRIPQLEIAVGDNATALIIRHLAEFSADDLQLLKEFAKNYQLQLYLQPSGLDSIHLFFPENANSLLNYRLPAYQLTFEFNPAQFIQVNAAINAQMIERTLQLLEISLEDHVLDLFCGIGNLTLPIAKFCKNVVGVEGDKSAVLQARKNAILNGLSHVNFYHADLFADITNEPWVQQKYNKIVLDPPRAGAQEILPLIPTWDPQRIVYISCNPATLTRDAKILSDLNYQLVSAGIMDMFPQTQHVEAIAVFDKAK